MAARIALVCDWLTTPGGAEKVLLELHRLYPDAPIYTSQYSKKGITWFADADVRTGWLQIFPKSLRKFLGPLRQLYFSRLDLTEYDLVISVTGAEAKGVKARQHLCYCHVPTQYYWQLYDQYLENPGFGLLNPLVRLCFRLFVKPLRKADYRAAQRPTQFITISTYAAAQIQKYYHRDSVIIAPPVETRLFHLKSTKNSTETSHFFHQNPELFHKNQTNIHKKSTGNPQESPDISTNNPQKQPDFSTKNRELSTGIPQVFHRSSTRNPQKSAAFSQLFHNFSTGSPQETVKNTKKPPFLTQKPSQTTQNLPTVSQLPQSPQKPSKASPEPPLIIACRQVTWKRVDLAIQACLDAEQPLLVVGDGPEHKNLVKLAHNSPLITFIPWLDSSTLAEYLQTARAYLFPSLEPFGIAAVEALAAGCPVIAYSAGGSRDFVHPCKNGLLFPEQTPTSLAAALKAFDPADFGRKTVQKSAEPFSVDHFRAKISALVNQTLTGEQS